MGTVVGTAAASALVPWDVPVRLVPAAAAVATPTGAPQGHRVDPGVELPGVRALDVVVVPAAGGELLTDVRPVRDVRSARGTVAAPVEGTLAGLLAALRDGSDTATVAVAVDGTPFAQAVLAALARVGVGDRRTYAALAAEAGRPRAVRAVASVMARNRVPLVLPCHRIVPSGGGTGRYGWGEDVKVALLDAEAEATGQRVGAPR